MHGYVCVLLVQVSVHTISKWWLFQVWLVQWMFEITGSEMLVTISEGSYPLEFFTTDLAHNHDCHNYCLSGKPLNNGSCLWRLFMSGLWRIMVVDYVCRECKLSRKQHGNIKGGFNRLLVTVISQPRIGRNGAEHRLWRASFARRCKGM